MAGGEGALENPTRKLIYNYISSNPGVSFSTVKRFFDMNDSTLKYHLNYLERNDKINSTKDGRRRCYFCKGQPNIVQEQNVGPTFDLLNENQQKILNMIRMRPGITQKELIDLTGLNRKTVGYNIEKFLAQNLIWTVKSEDGKGYELITEEKLHKEMYNRLLLKLLEDEIDEETFLKIKRMLEEMGTD